MTETSNKSATKPEDTDKVLAIIPDGFGEETGLEHSIPAVRVWGIVQFERAFSGNEASGMNESFTDVEPFLNDKGEIDARARIRATKFNYIRENLFRGLIREIARPYLKELTAPTTTASNSPVETATTYTGIVDEIFNEALARYFSGDKLNNYRAFFKALMAKTAACTPYDACGACPACIAEGSASTTSQSGISLPHNWEKKFKEIDFKTFKTVKSANSDQEVPLDGNILEVFLTETLVRNRTPRSQGVESGTTVENTVNATASSEAMMFWREHMFSGKGYAKTTLFNPTKLELAILADEWLVSDVRRGAKTSSGAGVWQIVKDKDGKPLLAVDEILKRRGFIVNAPIAAMPVDVISDDDGIEKCFTSIKQITDNDGFIKRYVGDEALKRLKIYHGDINDLEPSNDEERKKAFKKLVQYCASVIARLVEPKAAVERLKAEFDKTKNRDAENLKKAFEPIEKTNEVLKAVGEGNKDILFKSLKSSDSRAIGKFTKAFNKIKDDAKAFEILGEAIAAGKNTEAPLGEEAS